MTYELAKQLKEAGFPQNMESKFGKNRGHNWQTFNGCEESEFSYPGFEEGPAAPTLSELIGALPKNQPIQLYGQEGTWSATTGNLSGLVEVKGKTPSEAVANLWLALQKHV